MFNGTLIAINDANVKCIENNHNDLNTLDNFDVLNENMEGQVLN